MPNTPLNACTTGEDGSYCAMPKTCGYSAFCGVGSDPSGVPANEMKINTAGIIKMEKIRLVLVSLPKFSRKSLKKYRVPKFLSSFSSSLV